MSMVTIVSYLVYFRANTLITNVAIDFEPNVPVLIMSGLDYDGQCFILFLYKYLPTFKY